MWFPPSKLVRKKQIMPNILYTTPTWVWRIHNTWPYGKATGLEKNRICVFYAHRGFIVCAHAVLCTAFAHTVFFFVSFWHCFFKHGDRLQAVSEFDWGGSCLSIWADGMMLKLMDCFSEILEVLKTRTPPLVKRAGDCHRLCSGGDLLVQETRMSKAIIAWRRLHLLSIWICTSVRTCTTTCFGAHGRLHCCSSETWLYTPGLEYSKLGGTWVRRLAILAVFFCTR